MSDRTAGGHTGFGTGGIVGENGPGDCPDCHGEGTAVLTGNKFEWRLLDLENAHRRSNKETLPDVQWLIHEVRVARKALMAILTRCQDAAVDDDLAKYVRNQAMTALALYPKTKE